MIKKYVVIILALSLQFSFAQDIKFGKVSKEELLDTSYTQDVSANAVKCR